jgi:hypothetical protein
MKKYTLSNLLVEVVQVAPAVSLGNDAANSGRWYYNSSIATPSDPTNTYFNASSGLISSVTQIGISINTINSIDYSALV